MRLPLSHVFLIVLSLSVVPLYAADDWGADSWADEPKGLPWHGFVEAASGQRLQTDPALNGDTTLQELRGRLETETYLGEVRLSLKGDLYYDGVVEGLDTDLREALLTYSPAEGVDMRIGRQILTWGTGDLLFINDLFAKDWESFFAGRDSEYLKAASDSIKLSLYSDPASLDLVWTPRFTSDNTIDGQRFSYFQPLLGENAGGPDQRLMAKKPTATLANGELAARLHGTTGQNLEWALYAYHGSWKQPNAIRSDGQFYYSRLDTLGAGLRGNLAGGIANTELAWFRGADDKGDDPLLPNDQFRWLVGYERELLPRLTLGTQYYLEMTQDYTALKRTDGDSPYRPDKYRQLLTLRLNYRMWRDNLVLSWFSFWSPTDRDYYHRPSVSYRFDDHLSLSLGGNLFGGRDGHTFFAQFEDASNLYARLRYSF